MKLKISLVGIIVVIGAIGLGFLGVRWYLHRNAQSDQLSLLNAEYAYLSTLGDILQKQPQPEESASASVFLSTNSVNSVLAGMDNTPVEIPHVSQTTLKSVSLRTAFIDGFPEVTGDVEITHHNPEAQVKAKLHAALEPRLDKASPTALLLFIHPLSLDADVTFFGGSLSSEELNKLLRDVLVKYVASMPHISIPLSQDISIAFPATHIPLSVPTQHGKLNGEIDVPGLSTKTTVLVSGVFFLSDGIHVLLGVGDPAKVALPYQNDFAESSSVPAGGLSSALIAKSNQIEVLRAALQPKVLSLKVEGADFRVWVSKNLLSEVTNTFNALSPAARTVHYHTLSEEGQIYQTGGGGLGCGGYANLVGGNSAQADLKVGNFSTAWSQQGLSASAQYDFSFNAQVTGHVNGPAGPHATWVLNCVHIGWPFNKDVCTNLPSTTISCDTPIGGGVGLGSYGVHGTRTETLTAALNLHSDASNWLLYDVAIVSPDQIPMTIEVGLGQLGTAGFPVTFPVPHQPLLTGSAPSLFEQVGDFDVPGATSKHYKFTAAPTGGSTSSTGYAAVGKITVAWN